MDLASLFAVVVGFTLGGLVVAAVRRFLAKKFFPAQGGHGQERAELYLEAIRTIESLPISSDEKIDALVAIKDTGLVAPVLKEVIRLLPGSYKRDIGRACFCLMSCRLPEVTMTIEDMEDRHIELYDLLHEQQHIKMVREYKEGESRSERGEKLRTFWDEAALAMQKLDEYPQLISIIRDRGITDTRRALEVCATMKGSSGVPLAEGVL